VGISAKEKPTHTVEKKCGCEEDDDQRDGYFEEEEEGDVSPSTADASTEPSVRLPRRARVARVAKQVRSVPGLVPTSVARGESDV
jgi:hypothetical protein